MYTEVCNYCLPTRSNFLASSLVRICQMNCDPSSALQESHSRETQVIIINRIPLLLPSSSLFRVNHNRRIVAHVRGVCATVDRHVVRRE